MSCSYMWLPAFLPAFLHACPPACLPKQPHREGERERGEAKMPIFVFSRSLAPPPPPLPQGPALAMLREGRAGNPHRGPQHPPTTPRKTSGRPTSTVYDPCGPYRTAVRL